MAIIVGSLLQKQPWLGAPEGFFAGFLCLPHGQQPCVLPGAAAATGEHPNLTVAQPQSGGHTKKTLQASTRARNQ
jgi:hypothetical protein